MSDAEGSEHRPSEALTTVTTKTVATARSRHLCVDAYERICKIFHNISQHTLPFSFFVFIFCHFGIF
jgi:hypothetical protein